MEKADNFFRQQFLTVDTSFFFSWINADAKEISGWKYIYVGGAVHGERVVNVLIFNGVVRETQLSNNSGNFFLSQKF